MTDKVTVTADAIEIELAAPKAKAKKPCLCGLVRIDFPAANLAIEDLPKKYRDYAELNTDGYDDGGWIHLETGCEELTAKVFAPGHDARFKGLLQCAHRQGGEVTILDGGMAITSGPVDFAIEHTPNLVEAVTREVLAPVRKPRAKKDPSIEAKTVKARVGRWEYEGRVIAVGAGKDKTEHFHYVGADGTNKSSSNFTLI